MLHYQTLIVGYLPPVFAGGQGLGALSVLAGRLQARTPAHEDCSVGLPEASDEVMRGAALYIVPPARLSLQCSASLAL